MQLVQNAALRVSSGCLRMSAVDDIHLETKVLNFDPHIRMVSAQYLAGCLAREHHCHWILTQPNGEMDMKKSLVSLLLPEISPWITDHFPVQHIPPCTINNQVRKQHCHAAEF
jgi:hypothetical protein